MEGLSYIISKENLEQQQGKENTLKKLGICKGLNVSISAQHSLSQMDPPLCY